MEHFAIAFSMTFINAYKVYVYLIYYYKNIATYLQYYVIPSKAIAARMSTFT